MITVIALFALGFLYRIASMGAWLAMTLVMAAAFIMWQSEHHDAPPAPAAPKAHIEYTCVPPESYACKVMEADKTRPAPVEEPRERPYD